MSVQKMKNGKSWYVYIRYKDWAGKTVQHKKEGFTKKADAKEYEQEFLAKLNGSSDLTVKSLWELYIEDCKARLKPTTMANKEWLFTHHVLPYLGNLTASEVSPSAIRKWQNKLLSTTQENGKKYSPTYLKTVNNQVSAMFNYGIKYAGMKTNPCHVAGPMGKKRADTMQFWTVDEFNQFLAAVSDKPKSVVMFSLLFWTGMRSGEMLALTQSDFDLKAKTVSITKNFARQGKQDMIMEPKTPKSRRTIRLTDSLCALMQAYFSSLYQAGPTDRIFPSSTKSYLFHEMQRGCKRSGVKKIRVHDLRHSHASLLIELGYSPLMIAERLGHENIETTLQTYSHLYPNKQEELVVQLEKMQKCYDFATHKIS